MQKTLVLGVIILLIIPIFSLANTFTLKDSKVPLNISNETTNLSINITLEPEINETTIPEENDTLQEIKPTLTNEPEINLTPTLTPNVTINTTPTLSPNKTLPTASLTANITINDTLLLDSPIKKYVYANGVLIARINGDINYVHQDVQRNNRLTTNEQGIPADKSKFLPFGQKVINTGIKYSFSGKEEDESKDYNFLARNYDPNLGRFLSTDPARVEDNFYAYVKNNPINYHDPDGRQTQSNQQDSLITSMPQDTLKVGEARGYDRNGNFVRVTRVDSLVLDFPNLVSEIKQGIAAFDSAIANGLPLAEAIADIDSVSWKATVPYDTTRTGLSGNARRQLENGLYADSTRVAQLSSFFDGTHPDAVCREFVGLTMATLQVIAERDSTSLANAQVLNLGLLGTKETHYTTPTNPDSVVTKRSGHALIQVITPSDTTFVTWGRTLAPAQLDSLYNRGNPGDPVWTRGGFDTSNPTWRNLNALY
ncbi:RHS repeat-associated core domain-containing protein [archaeon]|jgi:RHS repeat-associated protein|nr:RHS repeat-associated core domain-containing protein [archaeon]